jgi:ribonucleoside-diphosphate reductase alpha chain
MKPIFVVKRDGSREPLDITKVQTQIRRACDGITSVSESMIELRASIQFEDGMCTETIDKNLLHAMINLINVNDDPETNHTNYQYVAGKQRLRMLRKDVYGSYEVPRLYDIVKRNVGLGVYTEELLEWYTEADWDRMDSFIDHDKDEKYSYAALEQLISKYLVRNRVTDVIYETPQVRYMVAAAVCFHMEGKNGKRLGYVRDYYEAASTGAFTLATPVLAGLGTRTKQFSSCVLISSDDTLDSIFATGEMMAKYAAKRAGIGVEFGRMRGLNSPIRGGEIKHTGIIPFLKKWFSDLRSCSQGGIRNASATMNLPIWHIQFDDYIVLKNNQGTEEGRVRHLDYCVQLNAFFFRRFKNKQMITLFDPADVPELYKAFHSDTALFEKLYVEAENNPEITRRKEIPATVLFKEMLLKERTDTGRIYLMFVDNVQRNTPFDVTTHPVVQTNLCVEILLPTSPFQRLEDDAGRIALCTLGSINWGKFKLPGEMRGACQILVRALSNILGYQDFLSIQSKLSNEEFEPLGVGVTNLGYWHAKRGLKYGESEALDEVKRWMEHQAYFLTEATVELAAEKGPCTLSHTTRYGKGEFPWENRAPGVDELTDFDPSLDWEPLRERMMKHGVRNATLMAIAPVESSSVVIDSTNGIEMPMELISVKESKAGSFVQVVPEYKKLKNKYQLMWDQADCVDYLKTAAVLAAFCDQSISTNTFYSPKHFEDKKVPATLIAKNLMLAHKWGLKTIYYSLMEKLGVKTEEAEALAPDIQVETISLDDEEACDACTL